MPYVPPYVVAYRTLESRHYCTTIISFYLSEESPQTHGGHLKPLNVHHWLQRKLRVVLLIVYIILLCSTWVGGAWENTFRSCFRKIIEESIFNSSEAAGENLLSGLLSGVTKPCQCCLLELKNYSEILPNCYLQAKSCSPSSLQYAQA